MRAAGCGMVMTSTQVDESAQHFYRKLGYRDAGGFVVDIPGCEQPMELIMVKETGADQSVHEGQNKPETDDMRESTALVMIQLLLEAGCIIRAYDPVAMEECKRRIGDSVTYCRNMYDAVLDADALLLLTEWKEFRLPTWGVIKKAMKRPLVIDGRNIFDTEELSENGFEYHCIGK